MKVHELMKYLSGFNPNLDVRLADNSIAAVSLSKDASIVYVSDEAHCSKTTPLGEYRHAVFNAMVDLSKVSDEWKKKLMLMFRKAGLPVYRSFKTKGTDNFDDASELSYLFWGETSWVQGFKKSAAKPQIEEVALEEFIYLLESYIEEINK